MHVLRVLTTPERLFPTSLSLNRYNRTRRRGGEFLDCLMAPFRFVLARCCLGLRISVTARSRFPFPCWGSCSGIFISERTELRPALLHTRSSTRSQCSFCGG